MTKEKESPTCSTCEILKNDIKVLKGKVTRLKSKLATNQEQWVHTFKAIQEQNRLLMVNTGKTPKPRESDLFLIIINPAEPRHNNNNKTSKNNINCNIFSENKTYTTRYHYSFNSRGNIIKNNMLQMIVALDIK